MATVAFIESNTTGTGHILARKAIVRGLEVCFLSQRPERYPFLLEEMIHPRCVDTQNPDAILTALRQCEGLAAVLSSSEYYLEAAAQAAQALGLPGGDPAAIAVCRDKWKMRGRLEAAGVAVPRTTRVTSRAQARAAWSHHTPPLVVKPVSGSGSLDVRLHHEHDTFQSHTEALLAKTENERGIPVEPTLLVQDYIDGPEFSVEMIGLGSRHALLGITAKYLGPPPYFVEVGHDFPAPLDDDTARRIADTACAALDAVGMSFGPTHTELRLRDGAPVLIEINPRLAGGMIPVMIEQATGVDVLDEVLALYLGEPVRLMPRRSGAASIGFVIPPRSGRLCAVQRPSVLPPGVSELFFKKHPGEEVVREGSFRDRIGHVIATGDTPHISRERVCQVLAGIQLEVEPSPQGTPAAAAGDTGRLKGTLHPEALAIVRRPPSPEQRRGELEQLAAIDEAHLVMLAEQGILSRVSVRAVLTCIREMKQSGFAGLVDSVAPRGTYLLYEDALIARLGVDVGGITHTGRSRNDINACVFRLMLRDRLTSTYRSLWRLRSALVQRAAVSQDVAMPIYSQYQPGLPGTFAYYLLGVERALRRDQQALRALLPALNTSPMGACAGGGTTFPIAQDRVAVLLGFTGICTSALDAVASRDLVLRLLSTLAISGVHVSRLAQDFQLWTTREFSLLALPDDLSGGSSMMPQKKNPYLLEMIKGRATRPMGQWVHATATMQGTPFSNSVEVGTEAVRGTDEATRAFEEATLLMALIVAGAELRPENMARCFEDGVVVAGGVVDALVRETGAPFRQVHRQVGATVTEALEQGQDASVAVLGLLPTDARPTSPLAWAHQYEYGGGPGQAATLRSLQTAACELDEDAAWLRACTSAWQDADASRRQAVDVLLASVEP